MNNTYGCYRCGAIEGDTEEVEGSAIRKCGECGSHSIVSFIQAMDIINDLYLNGDFNPEAHEELELGDE